jgi:FMN-dependent NADH-azoreductase
MPRKILHIDASAQGERSESRRLSNDFIEHWQTRYPEDRITRRDIVENPLPHIDDLIVGSMMTPAGQRSPEQGVAAEQYEELVREFLDADVLVLGVPMYNFTIPSTLKAWIDHITVPGQTFRYTAEGPVGLVRGKQVHILSTRGGFYEGSPMDHQVAYLQTLFGFLGVEDIQVIQAEGLNISPETRDQSMEAAHIQIQELLAQAAA